MSLIKYLNCQGVDVDLSHIPNIYDGKIENLCYMIFKKHRYFWNNCDLIYKQKGIEQVENWNNVKYLDYKVTTSMFEDDNSLNCLKNFLTNSQNNKILHLVNTIHEKKSLFDFDEWNIICDIVDKYSNNFLTIEVVNKIYFIEKYILNLNYEIEKCKEMFNCYRLEFFLFNKEHSFYRVPLILRGIDLPKTEYKEYVEY